MQSDEGYEEVLSPTRWSDEHLAELSGHLPGVDTVATRQGLNFTVRCSCGWPGVSEPTMARSGREFDQHIQGV